MRRALLSVPPQCDGLGLHALHNTSTVECGRTRGYNKRRTADAPVAVLLAVTQPQDTEVIPGWAARVHAMHGDRICGSAARAIGFARLLLSLTLSRDRSHTCALFAPFLNRCAPPTHHALWAGR